MTMLSNETARKLHEMRLGVMAEAFSAQLADVQLQGRLLYTSDPAAERCSAGCGACRLNKKTKK